MKKVLIDCDLQTMKMITSMLAIGYPEIQVVGMVVTEEKERSVACMIDMVRKFPGEIEIIALSTLSNIAAAIEKAPDVMKTVKRLIILGGLEHVQGDYSPVAEQNFGKDPKAAEIVFKNDSIQKVMAGLDALELLTVPVSVKKVFLALGMLNTDEAVQSKKAYVEIETEGIAAGQSVCDTDGEFHQGKTNAEIICGVTGEKVFSSIFRRVE